jgi:hypothetical protein
MHTRYYFSQISAPAVALIIGYVAIRLLKIYLGDWFQADKGTHVLVLGVTIIAAILGGIILWGRLLVVFGILSKEDAKGYPFSKPWKDHTV